MNTTDSPFQSELNSRQTFHGKNPMFTREFSLKEKIIPQNIDTRTSYDKFKDGILNFYTNYIKDYKLSIFLVVIAVCFLIFRYKETKKKKKIENFRQGLFNIPPYNQFVPYKDQICTMPLRMNPTPQLHNGLIDLNKNQFQRTYYHGLKYPDARPSDIRHPYDWEGNFNNVDDKFINPMVELNNQNIEEYNNIINTNNHNLIMAQHN